ncbi:MAG: efflux RND transporter permease subunit [Hyphomicrobiaceae bacterium]|nr:efflux RND transporter permease subunit [Hyphomicrobiaceae bacterium]
MAEPHRTNAILQGFVTHRNAANLLMILLVIFGFYGVIGLNRQLFPDTNPNTIRISLSWSGASADDIEKNLLQVIEPTVRFLDGVRSMSSNASEGRGTISLSFERNTDMRDAENRVQTAVDSIPNLPESADAPVVSRQKFFDPVASIGIAGPFPENALRNYAREIRDGLLDAGVDQVSMSGYRDRQITISVDDAKLRQLDLTLDSIATAISPNLADRPSGTLSGSFEAQIRAVAPDVTPEDLAATEIKSLPTGEVLTLGDVATITDGFNENTSLGFMRGEPAIRLTVSRSATADSVSTYDTIRDYVEKIKPTLPASLNIQVFDAAAQQINDRLSLIVNNGASGLVLVIIILFLFLDWRIAIWVAAGIPVSIAATLGVMYATGQSINMISMFAMMMTLGIIVDDAIVVGEHTATRFALGDSPRQAALTGAGHMFIPVIAASLTTMAAFGPILAVREFIGQIMAPLPLVVLAVLTASSIECFLILPGHLAHSLPSKRRPPSWFRRNFDKGFAFFRDRLFGALSRLSFSWRYATVAIALAVTIIGFSLIGAGKIGFSFFPTSESDSFRIFANFQPGTPQDQMAGIVGDIEQAITKVDNDLSPDHPLVLTTYATLDLENGGTSINVYLTPSETRSVRTPDFTRAIQAALPKVAGVQSITVREQRGGPGGRAIDVQLIGTDVAALKKASEDLQGVLEGFSGVNAISDTLSYGSPEVTMHLTPRGAALGFTLASLGTQIRDAFEGRTVDTIAANNDEIAIILKRNTDLSGSSALRDLWVRASSGNYVPLSSVVTFSERQVFSRINREDGRTVVDVQADVDSTQTTADDVLKRLESDYLPQIISKYGISYDLAGEQRDFSQLWSDLTIGSIIALALMYVIISWSFGSWFLPVAVMLIIPFGIVGAIWGHYLLGYDLTSVSLMGLLGLSGILVNDSIVLISRMLERRQTGEGLREAATGASRDRLRAVLLTSLTTIGGLVPLLFEKSLQAQFLIPMAITLVFGLGLATLLVLFLVPAFIGIGADFAAIGRWLLMTKRATTFRELIGGVHLDQPPQAGPVHPAE